MSAETSLGRFRPQTRGWVGGWFGGAVWRAGVTMVAVLGALASTVALRRAAGLSAQLPVLAAVLALTLRRVSHDGARQRIAAAVQVPVLALAAGAVGWLFVHHPWAGQPLLVIALSVGIAARRYGGLVQRAGRLMALPFLALLITPVAATPGSAVSSIAWAPVVALIALAWTTAVTWLVQVAGVPGSAPPATAGAPHPRRTASRSRLDAPTRMALQMAVGLTAAAVDGHLIFGQRWEWTMLSVYLVASGNRGRGDVVHKAGLRVVGAASGTLVATLTAASLPGGHRLTLVALFVVLAVSLVLRERSYAFWAAGVTAVLTLLHAFYGEPTTALLGERLLGVLLGSLIGVASAWFVTPVRTRDVLRRRIADALAALTDELNDQLNDDGAGRPPRFADALARLDQLTPTLRAHHRFVRRALGRGRGDDPPHPVEAIAALHQLEPLPPDPAARRRLRRDVVRVRRAMAGSDRPAPDSLPPPLATVLHVLSR